MVLKNVCQKVYLNKEGCNRRTRISTSSWACQLCTRTCWPSMMPCHLSSNHRHVLRCNDYGSLSAVQRHALCPYSSVGASFQVLLEGAYLCSDDQMSWTDSVHQSAPRLHLARKSTCLV